MTKKSKMNKKKWFTRGGVTRQFSTDNIARLSTPESKFPESQGWVPVPGEVEETRGANRSTRITKTATPAPPPPPKRTTEPPPAVDVQTSKDFTASDDSKEEIRTHLAGKTPADIEAFFANEKRKGLLELKEELLNPTPNTTEE